MRKYILLLLFILSFFSSAQVSVVHAGIVGAGEECEVPKGRAEMDRCDSSLNLTCVDNVCVERRGDDQTNQPVACSCLEENVSGAERVGGNVIKCPGLPDIACAIASKACYVSNTEPISSSDINFLNNGQAYTHKIITNVTCKPKQEFANCTCTGTNEKKNDFECSLATDPNIKGTATCRADEKCMPVDQDKGINNIAENQRGDLFDNHSVNMRGIKCENPEKAAKALPPIPPPPPPPPCKTVVAGICTEFNTAFGGLGTAPEDFIQRLFAILLSASGGIALLLIMKAGYQMLTSQGKPEQLQGGRDQLVAAIVGLVFLIFSFVILQVIGFDILRIPGFGGAGAGTGGGGSGVAGAPCDLNGNNQCGGSGLECVATGNGGRSGTCQ